MAEILPEPILLITETDFRVCRRLSRRTIPSDLAQIERGAETLQGEQALLCCPEVV
jgi:hypothetical protein